MNVYLSLAGTGFVAVMTMVTALWLLSLRLRDASIVDRFWGMTFVVLVWSYALAAGVQGLFPWLVVALVTIWGLRLSLYIHFRNRGHGEDYRYERMREEHGRRFWWYSYISVFGLQGVIAWVVSAPLLFIMASPEPVHGIGVVAVGVALWVVGMIFEAGGDWQLSRFKRDPANKGKLLTTGLWSLSRHPNYFGDATLWWGYYVLALAVDNGWISAYGPVLMTALIVFVSGVAMMEKDQIAKRPAYADYIRSTPAFVPWPRFLRRKSLASRAMALVALMAAAAGLALSMPATASAGELKDGQIIRFEVFDTGDGSLLYSGTEQISVSGGEVRKETTYLTPDSTEVMRDDVRYDLETLQVNSFTSEYPLRGERLTLRRDGDRLDIKYQPGDGEPAKRSDALTWSEETRLGKTLHHIILRQWERLTAGEKVSFDLLVPSRFDAYRFRIRTETRSESGDYVFRLEPENLLVRQFVSPMDFHYDQSRRATRYVGPTTVNYAQNPDKRIEIRFSY